MGIYSPGGDAILLEILEGLAINPGARVLELGCGNGDTAEYLRERYGCDVTGVDVSAALIGRAKVEHGKIKFLVCGAEEITFPDGSFDLVICECILSLCENPAEVIGRVAKALGCGGRLVILDLFERVGGINDTKKVTELAGGCGLVVSSEADKTYELKTWAAGIVMDFGSIEAYYKSVVPAGERVSAYCPAVAEMTAAGYAVIIFERK
jgi:ubiquinone/menaquinone biosynthesis C-methylase UbiE